MGRLAREEAHPRETPTGVRPALEVPRCGVAFEALDPWDCEPLLDGDPPPGLDEGAAVAVDPAEREAESVGVVADCVEDVPDGACVVGTGVGAGAVGTGVGAVGTGAGAVGTGTGTVGTGAGTVGVGSGGTVTDVMVGSVGGSRASAGPTSVAVAATATAKHTIDTALRIPLYNPHRRLRVTLLG